MKIKSVRLYELRIPFKFNITHTLKSRSRSYSIIVTIETNKGKLYYGEGCPREYVIDEPKDRIIKTFKEMAISINDKTLDSVDNIKKISDTISDTHKVPSLASAFSIALLNAYSVKVGVPVYKLINQNTINHQLCPYSGILSTTNKEKFRHLLSVIKKLELPHVKLKVGHPDDVDHVRIAREVLGDDVELRIDGNRAWTVKEAIEKIPKFYKYNISGIEEPLIAAQIMELPHLSKHIEVPIILDESIYHRSHAQYYIDHIDSDKIQFNLKISKLGGPLRASGIYQLASHHSIMCMLGCNVGESAILSATGRSFAQAHKLKNLEGSYAPFFMEADISAKPMMFNQKGIAEIINENGLGVHINKNNMQVFSTEKSTIVK